MTERIIRWSTWFLDALRAHRRLVSVVLYGLITTLAFYLAFLIRFELDWPPQNTSVFLAALPVLLALRLTLAKVLKLSTGRWRFISTQDILRLVAAVSIGSLFFFIITWELGFPVSVPRSVILLEWILTTYGTAGMWFTYRILFQKARQVESVNGTPDRRVVVIGAGEAGAMLIREMGRFPTGYRPVGILDDDASKHGLTIHGVQVSGPVARLSSFVREHSVDEIIIAVPSATPDELNSIVGHCERIDQPFKLLPGIAEVLAGDANLNRLRPVQIEDLLGREPIDLELPALSEELEGNCVLVTGAAGSIGSELCQQIALHNPEKLILLDQAETPLVKLDLHLRSIFPRVELIPVVSDVTDESGLKEIFEVHRPDQVFHAAAYKHVPMMELNPSQAVRNNVYGTWVVAKAAGESASAKFVLVSTDKAVQPRSVMGATKRLAEVLVQQAQELYPDTSFAAVRFGNVLGSNGSVIPLFQRQLKASEPLTVTDPEVTRYFMTISEAVQLILQASMLPELRGHVAMLDMGEPVRIVDLARKILRLSGLPARIGQDIIFTGLRPGEKLHEELVAPEETTRDTSLPKVKVIIKEDGWSCDLIGEVAALRDGVPSGSVDAGIPILARYFPEVVGIRLGAVS